MTSKHLGKLILVGVVFIAVFGYVVFRVWGGTLIGLTLTSNASLEQGLVGHWSMDGKDIDTSSSTAEVRDRSGQGNNGNFIAPITFRAASSTANSSGAATSVTVSKPTGTIEGDVMIAALGWDANGSITAPSGWTLIRSTLFNTDNNVAAWYKVAGASEPANYTWSQPANDDFSVGIATYYNVNKSNPINVENAQTNSASSNVVAPSVTTTVANTMLVFIGSIDHNNVGNTWTPPSGMNERVDQTNKWTSIEIADVVQASAGSSGTKTGVTTDSQANVGHLIALNPALPLPATGKIGQALSFDGVNDYVQNSTIFTPDDNTEDYTMSAWFKADTITGWRGIAGWTSDVDADEPYAKLALRNDSKLHFYSRNDAGGTPSADIYTDTLSSDTWYYAVATKSGSVYRLYVNGAEATSTTATISGTFTSRNSFLIGTFNEGSVLGSYVFDGTIDDVRVYNRALSATEVSRLYNLGATTHISKTLNTNPNLASGLVGHWTFDGPKMLSNVGDSSGQGNNGLLSGQTSTTTSPGRIGQGLSFDGVNDYVDVGAGSSLTVNDNVTIAAWIKPVASSDAAFERIVTTSDSYSPDGYGLAYDPSDDKIVAGFGSAAPANQVTYKSTVTAPENTWSHVVMTASGSGGSTVKIYVNGVEVTNGTEEATSITFDAGAGVFLGIRHNLSATNAFNGQMDDVRAYNRALSAAEISRLYNLGATTHISKTLNTNPNLASGLVGHWTFDGPKMLSNVGDSSGQGNNGNLSGQAATTTIIGRVGQALYFDGVNDYVKVPSVTAFDFASTGGFSYFTWFKKDGTCSSVEGNEVFTSRFGSDHAVRTWWFGCSNTAGSYPNKLMVDVLQDATGNEAVVRSASAINDSTWHHGGWVYDGSANQVRLYLDGVLQGASTTAFTGSFNVANPICIGSYGTNCNGKLDDGGAYEADAVFDDVRVYNRALSANEVSRLYQLGR